MSMRNDRVVWMFLIYGPVPGSVADWEQTNRGVYSYHASC
jgi:hypothetical protein